MYYKNTPGEIALAVALVIALIAWFWAVYVWH
jgi:hypothetical protein